VAHKRNGWAFTPLCELYLPQTLWSQYIDHLIKKKLKKKKKGEILKWNKAVKALSMDVVVHSYNPSTQEDEAGGSQVQVQPVTKQAPGQPRLHYKTCLEKQNRTKDTINS
jgi:hypothetical protein